MSESGKNTYNWEKLTAISSMLVAACALVISVWQSYSIQQHNKLSLRPYLEVELNYVKEGNWDIYINNNGTGPAQVKDVQYFVDGKSYTSREDFLVALGEDPSCYVRGNIGRFYKVADRQVVFRTLNENCFKAEADIQVMLSKAKIILNYQSLYGESYQLVIGSPDRA